MRIQSGQLRQRVTVQALTATPNAYGQPVETWSNLGTFWANVRPLNGREAIVAKQVQAEATTAITLRWLGSSTTITPENRLLYGSRTLGIVQVLNIDERNRQLELLCTELD